MDSKLTPGTGYAGRVQLHNNPWNQGAFNVQICTIVLAPTAICVSIYLILKHVALALNPTVSRVNPIWYPRIFLPADISCLLVQAIGGGIAASAGKSNPERAQQGNKAIIAGVALQVVVLVAFGVFATDYYLRVRKYFRGNDVDPQRLATWRDGKFRMFAYAVIGAYGSVLTRCIYR